MFIVLFYVVLLFSWVLGEMMVGVNCLCVVIIWYIELFYKLLLRWCRVILVIVCWLCRVWLWVFRYMVVFRYSELVVG